MTYIDTCNIMLLRELLNNKNKFMNIKKSLWLISTVLVLVLLLITSSNKTEDHIIKIGYAPNIAFLPVHIADTQGYFTEAGLKVELVPLQSAQQLYEALVREEIDYVPFLSSVVVMTGEAIDPGKVKLVSVSDISLESQFDALMIKGDSSIASLSDLKGKKVGVYPGTTGMNFLKQYLQIKGVDYSDIQFVQLPPPTQLQALESGAIDALYSYEPNYTIGIEKFGFKKLVPESIFASQINHSAFGGYWFSTTFGTNHKKLSEKLIRVIDKSNNVLSTNETLAREVAKETYSLDENVAQKINLVKMVPTKEFKPELFSSFTDYLVKIGELKAKPDLSNIFYK